MNILLLHSSSDLYGASKVLLNTIDAIKDKHKLFVCLSKYGPLVDEIQKRKVHVHIVELGILRRKYYSMSGMINRGLYLFVAFIKITKICKINKIELIYSNTTATIIGAIVAKYNRIKHIWHIHEIIQSPILVAKYIAYLLNKYAVNNICVSNRVAEHWITLNPALTGKLDVIYNGFLFSENETNSASKIRKEYKIPENSMIVGMVARINHWKGQLYFLEIAKEICQKMDNIYFVMIGDTYPGYESYEQEIKENILRYKLSKNVFLLGFRTDVFALLHEFDVFVLPSILPDPLPTTVLEAMAAKCPVVATNHGGATEMVINDETGILVPWDDARRAYNLMEILLNDKATRVAYGQAGYRRVNTEYTVKKYVLHINRYIDSL